MKKDNQNESTSQKENADSAKKNRKCSLLSCQCFCCKIPQRVILALLAHMAFQNAYNLRVVLNVAMPTMVPSISHRNKTDHACPGLHQKGQQDHQKGDQFYWNRPVQLLILYAFYIGYTLSHLPGGYLADKFGGRWVLFFSMSMSVVLTVIFPFCITHADYWIAIMLRGLLGVVQGPILPALTTLVSRWVPDEEKYLAGIAYSGSNLGTVIGNILTGTIIDMFRTWHAAFYFWSGWSLLYIVLHLVWLYSYPEKHPFITKEEFEYLDEKIVHNAKLRVPWKQIFTNVPFWANVCGQFAHFYIFFVLVTCLPTYMCEILGYDIKTMAYLSAVPFFVLWFFSIFYSCIGQYLERCMGLRMFNVIFGTFSNVGCGACVLAAMYVGCSRLKVMSLFTLAMVIKPFYYCTMPVNINEMSRHYGGILMAIANTFATVSGVLGNVTVGQLTTKGQIEQWQLVFWISFGVTVVMSLIFAIFSSPERQEFDILPEERQARRPSAFTQLHHV